MKKTLSRVIIALICVLFLFAGCTAPVIETESTTQLITETTTEESTAVAEGNSVTEQTLPDEVLETVNDVAVIVEHGGDIASDEIVPQKEADEEKLEDDSLNKNEEGIEPDASVEQENISYDGVVRITDGKSLISGPPALTYYSQADSRWGSLPYTATGSKSQTIKSSGCGPTSAAMVVSASKGIVTPPTMVNVFLKNKHRTANNGTAWTAWPDVADIFDFKEYHSTGSADTALKYLKTDKNKDGVPDYYIVVSCGYGLFTSGGHYITLMGYNDGTIMVYDPYLYYGKFNTSSRKAAGVTVSGNAAYVTVSNFKKYANPKRFWVYSNDAPQTKITDKSSEKAVKSDTKTVNYTRYVATQVYSLNVRSAPNGTVVGYLTRGDKVTVIGVSGSWSQINTSKYKGKWVSTAYLSATKVSKTTTKTKYVTASVLNVRNGPGTKYKVVGYKKNGNKVTVYSTKNGWSKISSTKDEWVSNTYLTSN